MIDINNKNLHVNLTGPVQMKHQADGRDFLLSQGGDILYYYKKGFRPVQPFPGLETYKAPESPEEAPEEAQEAPKRTKKDKN
jgi:hypothetical protein